MKTGTIPCILCYFLLFLFCAETIPSFSNESFTHNEQKISERLLEEQAIKAFAWFERYRVESTGLVLDRGCNSNEEDRRDLSSIAACGYYLSFLPEAIRLGWIENEKGRDHARHMLRYALDEMNHDRGFFYHFYDARTGKPSPRSEVSVLDTSIFLNGVMVASVFFGGEINEMGDRLLDRVEWPVVCMDDPDSKLTVLSMAIRDGRLGYPMNLRSSEYLLAYWLAVGSRTHPVSPKLWYHCKVVHGEAMGRKVINPGSPLFLSYYSLAWQALEGYVDQEGIDLVEYGRNAALSNREYCRSLGNRFETYSESNGGWWGLSAGDSAKGYVAQGPNDKVDGTVWPVTALASMTLIPDRIDEDIEHWYQSDVWSKIDGPYGLSPFNLTTGWFAKDLIAIDLGSFLLDWANRNNNTIRDLWMKHPVAQTGFKRLQWSKKKDLPDQVFR